MLEQSLAGNFSDRREHADSVSALVEAHIFLQHNPAEAMRQRCPFQSFQLTFDRILLPMQRSLYFDSRQAQGQSISRRLMCVCCHAWPRVLML